jgi:hypothetical protein
VKLRYHVDHIRIATVAGFVEIAQARRYAKDFCRELSRKIKAAAPLDRQKRPVVRCLL